MLVQHTNIIVVTEMSTSCRVGRKLEPSLSLSGFLASTFESEGTTE